VATDPKARRTKEPAVPYDADDEAVLLGAALLTSEAADLVAHHTVASDFHVPLHQRVRNAIAGLVASGSPVDPATVASDLSRNNGVADIGAAKRQLLALQAACPNAANAAHYLRQVRDWGRRRRALSLGHQLQDSARHGHPIEGILAQIEGLGAEEKLDTTSWQEIPLEPVLDGDSPDDTEPTMLVRADGGCLLYPGRVHVFAGEPESGKTWLALHACAEQILVGNHVLYVDFEDTATAVTARLRALGVERDRILGRFHYVRPTEPLGPEGRYAIAQLLTRTLPTLVVVDGLTEALTLHGLALESNKDVATFFEMLPRFVARQGPGVVIIDHVEKDTERRGRWAIGAQHKLAGIDGVSYGLEVIKPVVRDGEGLVRLVIRKDRPGHVRRLAPDRKTAAEIVTVSAGVDLDVTLAMPGETPVAESTWQPTGLMERISRWLELQPAPPSMNQIESERLGKRNYVRQAMRALVDDGYVAVTIGPNRARLHQSVKPYRTDPNLFDQDDDE